MKVTVKMIDAFRAARDRAFRITGLYSKTDEGHLHRIADDLDVIVYSQLSQSYVGGHRAMMRELDMLRCEAALKGALAAAEPAGWFVKDFADGFIFFVDENAAREEAAATGALLLVAYKEAR